MKIKSFFKDLLERKFHFFYALNPNLALEKYSTFSLI